KYDAFAGEDIQVTGNISWPGAILPDEIPPIGLYLETCDELSKCDRYPFSVTLDAAGNYSVSVPAYQRVRMHFAGGTCALPIDTPIQTVTVHPVKPGTFTSITGSWMTRNSARIAATIRFADPQPASVPIRIEYRWLRSSQWITLGYAWAFKNNV